jgi:hypothetical protein
VSAELQMKNDFRTPLDRLDALIGTWRTEGWTIEAPAEPVVATDTYERLPGGGLLHLVDAWVGDRQVEGAEIIGYDPARGGYVTQYFGSDGASAYVASIGEYRGALVWAMASKSGRFTGTFNHDRTVITGRWEALDHAARWRPSMDITLTREAR